MKLPRLNTLWLGVGLLFALLFAAWAVMLTVAAKNPTATVPLESAPAGTTVKGR